MCAHVCMHVFVYLQWFGSSKQAPDNLEKTKGMYMYGSVGESHTPFSHSPGLCDAAGAGKTMLMDLFYGSAHVAKKRRVHFNAFMLDVHNRKFAC